MHQTPQAKASLGWAPVRSGPMQESSSLVGMAVGELVRAPVISGRAQAGSFLEAWAPTSSGDGGAMLP
jgi:hypothetical protein